MGKIYRNRMILNQRGGAITIDNTTDQEKVIVSQRSGSNITFSNVVTSELATNNKQTNVVNDSYNTVGGDSSEAIGGDNTVRVGGSSITLKGFKTQDELAAYTEWKEQYQPIAKANSEFKIKRGGVGYPNGNDTELKGERSTNPVLDSSVFTLMTFLNGSIPIGRRRSNEDTVASYTGIIRSLPPAGNRTITLSDVESSAGANGSAAPGVVEFGGLVNPSTEGGIWEVNDVDIEEELKNAQSKLTLIEQNMGDGGDEFLLTKRNKFEQVGATFNDFPSVKIDEYGRSQPLEMLVSPSGAYKNHDYMPHVEEVDNSSNFPCGNDDAVVGNRFSRTVGSGGIHFKTTGTTELGGTLLKVGFKSMNINASHSIQIASEKSLELQSLKTITLRTNRQVYVESSLGVKNNLIVGGGAYIEGELYCNHITAPLEIHETQDTSVYGQFATNSNRSLVIGEAEIGGNFYPVYAVVAPDLIVTYPHSHHHVGIPLRLVDGNATLRETAQAENINNHLKIAQSLPVMNERKNIFT